MSVGRHVVRHHSPEPQHHGVADDHVSAADEQLLAGYIRVGLGPHNLSAYQVL